MNSTWLRVSGLGVAALAFIFSGCVEGDGARPTAGGGITSGVIEHPLEPSRVLPVSDPLLEAGRSAYEKQCSACHGITGAGDGEAAWLLYPRPRDFTRGEYRLVSTWEGIPQDEDLYRTISRGMPGSAMPSWAHLPEETRWGLVHYVKSFSRRPLDISPPKDPSAPGGEGKGLIRVSGEPAWDDAARARAKELFARGCASCHGPEGKGDGTTEQKDSSGLPTRPRDLTAGVFKGSPEPEQVYRRLVAGLPGSPMPSSAYLHGDDAWHLTHFVLGMSSPGQREQVEMRTYRIVARHVESLPTHPDSGTWRSVDAVSLHLMPLWWRPHRPEAVTVKAAHDGKRIALLMVWSDSTDDHTAMRPQDFRDGAAVEFSLAPDPPFFAMGEATAAVNIWMWKSERQADLEPAFQELDKIYPNLGIDSYPNFLRSPVEQPTRHALTLESDPTYVTAWGAGNIVSDPTTGRAAEDLEAHGFGSLRARPRIDQQVESAGAYATGSYRVVFMRDLSAQGKNAVVLSPGASTAVSFAVWNGSEGDRDGKKSVTIWQELVLER